MAYLKENDLLKTFESYLLDIKPYHTKLDGIYVDYLFQDRFQVSLTEHVPIWQFYLQNVFASSDKLGGWRLYNTIDSSINSKKFLIPQTIIPRFSINTFNEQFPVGHNPATENDPNPVNEVPWYPSGTQFTRQGWSYSHQQGITDELPYYVEIASKVILIDSIVNITGTITATYDVDYFYDTANVYGADITTLKLYVNGTLTATDANHVFDQGDEKVTIKNLTKTFTLSIVSDKLLVTSTVNGQTLIEDLSYLPLAAEAIAANDITDSKLVTALTSHIKQNLYSDNQNVLITFTESGTYRIPFHNGSYVTVNSTPQVFGTDYIVSGSRNFIQFLTGKHPVQDDDIRINYFNVDRLFISITLPFDVNVTDGYDDRSYDNFPYDNSNDDGELINTDYFLLTVDNTLPGGYSVQFFNAIDGTNKASMQDIVIDSSAPNGEIWTITAINQKVVSVTGSITGNSGKAYYRQRYSNGKIAFTLDNTFLSYYMIPDNPQPPLPGVGGTATYSDIDYDLFGLFTFGGSRDTQDYLINLNLTETHGVPPGYVDQAVSYFDDPVDLNPLGTITMDSNQNYYFNLSESQPVGSVIEFRVEQNNQYNTWVQIEIKENLIINEITLPSDYLDLIQNGYDIPDFDSQGIDIITERDADGTLHNEPFQIATAGVKDDLRFFINYVDSTPDEIIQEATIYSDKYSQGYFDLGTVVRTGTGNGTVVDRVSIDGAIPETWTLTCTNATIPATFSVVGSTSGTQLPAVVGVKYYNDVTPPYNPTLLSFTIEVGTVPFIVGDHFVFSFTEQNTTNELILKRYPYTDGGDNSGPSIFKIANFVFVPIATANGDVVSIAVDSQDPTVAVIESWTVTASSATTWTVNGSISGLQSPATTDTVYDNGIVTFKIRSGSIPFSSGDRFTFDVDSGFVTTSLDSGGPTIDVITPDVIYDYDAVSLSPTVVGTGNGVIQITDINQSTAVEETWTLTATSSSNFTVVGSISGSQSAATVGTPYSGIISFLITAGGTSFVSGDHFIITVKKDWSTIHIKFNTARTFDLYLV